jgi:hypothetical protein
LYPQTHLYFAEKILGKISDEITIGSIFPDFIISKTLPHEVSHQSGHKIFNLCRSSEKFLDLARAVITHGIKPHGLDYYGDEKYLDYERGYCFEKGRPFIGETVKACNIPLRMGWWKAHNIIEMGIELRINAIKDFGPAIRGALENKALLKDLDDLLGDISPEKKHCLVQKAGFFIDYIETAKVTALSLAAKYNTQMITKHNISVNIAEVAALIEKAALVVENDLEDFFLYSINKVKDTLKQTDIK